MDMENNFSWWANFYTMTDKTLTKFEPYGFNMLVNFSSYSVQFYTIIKPEKAGYKRERERESVRVRSPS